ncbi:MAG: DMT family transporter [Synechococcaceae cyanobacterium]|nr:DMT family transporter [Synechococcaceae cyanobacterium]
MPPVTAVLLSVLSFSLMGVCVKALGGRLPVSEVVLARSVVSLAISQAMLQHAGLSPWGPRWRMLTLRGLFGTLALYGLFAAYSVLPLAAVTVIQFLNPALTALLAWWCLAERPSATIALGLLLGWLGVVVLLAPGTPASLPLTGVLLAAGSSLLAALAYVSVRSLARSVPTLVIVYWFPLVGVLLSLPALLLEPVLPTPREGLLLLGVGVFTHLGQLGLTRGLAQLPAARATALTYGQVPLAACWGWLFFGEVPAGTVLLAALLVLASTWLSLRPSPPPPPRSGNA